MKNNKEFGMPVRVFEGLNEELWKLKKKGFIYERFRGWKCLILYGANHAGDSCIHT